jgi:hypothetical protein
MSVDPSSRGWNEHRHLPELDEWRDFVPTFQQGATPLTTSFLRARFQVLGQRTVNMTIIATFSSAGSAGDPLTVNLPSGVPANANAFGYGGQGDFTYLDSGTAWESGSNHFAAGGRTIQFFAGGSRSNVFGSDPSFAVAAGDTLVLNATYELVP